MSSAVSSTQASSGSQVSAFAVYKNLIPGVKVYEDHNNIELAKAGKRRKRKNKSSPIIANGVSKSELKSPSGFVLGNKAKKPADAPTSPRSVTPKKRGKRGTLPNPIIAHTPIPNNVIDYVESRAAQIQKEREETHKLKRKISENTSQNHTTLISPQIGDVALQNGDHDLTRPKKSKKKQSITANASTSNGIDIADAETERTPTQVFETPSKRKKAKKMKHEEQEVAVGGSPEGKDSFKWLIHPMPVTEFFSKYWEKQPLLIKRKSPTYYGNLLTSAMLDTMLRNNIIRFGKNIDVTSYANGERETHNPSGRAMPPVVWDYFVNGCSIRVLNPQTYIEPVWKLNSSLQDYLGTFVGANVYLTPKNSQGFAPHWDDIEAFVLQLEGRKRWRVYEPLETLPKASSGNLKDEMIGKPLLDVILEPGDLLYFPRGFIHQANAQREHSLHITLSCYQNNSYSDFLKEYLPLALDHATVEKVAFREGLPRDYLQYMGVAHADREDLADKRQSFVQKIKKLATTLLMENSVFDFAADQMGKRVIWDSLPPFVEKSEIRTTVSSDVNFTMSNGLVGIRNQVELDTEIRLLRANCVRLVIEDACLKLYYSTDNSLEYHGEEAQYIEMVEEAGPAVEFLIAQYPRFVKVQDIPVDIDEDMKLQIVTDLWEKGILRTNV